MVVACKHWFPRKYGLNRLFYEKKEIKEIL